MCSWCHKPTPQAVSGLCLDRAWAVCVLRSYAARLGAIRITLIPVYPAWHISVVDRLHDFRSTRQSVLKQTGHGIQPLVTDLSALFGGEET